MPGIKVKEPKGAFYVFPNISGTGMSSEKFSEWLLEKARVVVIPGTAFGRMGEGYVRISYATSKEKLIEAMNRIEKALEGEK